MTTQNVIWGPYAWYKFHTKALDYVCSCNKEEIVYFYYQTFLTHIKCDNCKNHYRYLLKNHPIELTDPYQLFCWTVEIHNLVNFKLGKRVISCEEAIDIWNRKLCYNPASKNICL